MLKKYRISVKVYIRDDNDKLLDYYPIDLMYDLAPNYETARLMATTLGVSEIMRKFPLDRYDLIKYDIVEKEYYTGYLELKSKAKHGRITKIKISPRTALLPRN